MFNLKLAKRAYVPLSRVRERVRREGNGYGDFHLPEGYCHDR